MRPAALAAAAALLLACQRPKEGAAEPEPAPGEVLTSTTQVGPVKAVVTLSPKRPRLGDPLTLTLTVEAEAGVAVEMPPFGEALGRFTIVNFTPRSEARKEGGSRASQRYQLEAPMSGRQRVPPLRVEFVDNRPGLAGAADGGADDRHKELETDELSVDIASVEPQELDKEAQGDLRGLRGELPEHLRDHRALRYGAPPLALALAAGAYLLLRRLRRRAAAEKRVAAHLVALSRLGQLEAQGLPTPAQADGWFVDLSDIVRRYIEDRYHVRAPELTTEEFLREAQALLQAGHRSLLATFLSTCDRVKFAGYQPAEEESRDALAAARRFISDSSRAPGAEGAP